MSKPVPSTQLSPQELLSTCAIAWSRLRKRFFKLEERQSFAEPEEPSYQAFAKGEMRKAVRLVRRRVATQAEMYASARSRGVDLIRVRIVDFPVHPYIQYEWPAYHVNASIGEKVFAADRSCVRELHRDPKMRDFLLFDESMVVLLDYGRDGCLETAERIDDPHVTRGYAEFGDQLLQLCIPLAQFEQLHPSVMRYVDSG